MLQIIGWLGCFYLVVKALEIMARDDTRAEDGRMKLPALMACLLAIAGACGFAVWLGGQGAAFQQHEPSTPDYLQPSPLTACLGRATTDEEAAACVQ